MHWSMTVATRFLSGLHTDSMPTTADKLPGSTAKPELPTPPRWMEDDATQAAHRFKVQRAAMDVIATAAACATAGRSM